MLIITNTQAVQFRPILYILHSHKEVGIHEKIYISREFNPTLFPVGQIQSHPLDHMSLKKHNNL